VGDAAQEQLLVSDLDTRLAAIAAPALVVVGALDHPDIHAIAGRLVRELPDATHAIVPGAAHLPSLERPAAFDELAVPFLAVSRRA
jgi:pimeloyl-ACP methyl ester carboxylesterase